MKRLLLLTAAFGLLLSCNPSDAPSPIPTAPLDPMTETTPAAQLPEPESIDTNDVNSREYVNYIVDLAIESEDDETAKITWTQHSDVWAEVQRVTPSKNGFLSRGSTTVRDGVCDVSSGGACMMDSDGSLLYEPRTDATDGKFWFRIRERTEWPEGWIRYTEDGRYWPWSDVVEVTLEGKIRKAEPGGQVGGSGGSGGGGSEGGSTTCETPKLLLAR